MRIVVQCRYFYTPDLTSIEVTTYAIARAGYTSTSSIYLSYIVTTWVVRMYGVNRSANRVQLRFDMVTLPYWLLPTLNPAVADDETAHRATFTKLGIQLHV